MASAALGVVVLLGTSGCSTDPFSVYAPTEAGRFCTKLTANGATGASFGPIPTFYRQKMLLDDVEYKLMSMGDATPPEEIAEPWALQKNALLVVKAAATRLSGRETLSEAEYGGGEELDHAQHTLTDYWFAHCG